MVNKKAKIALPALLFLLPFLVPMYGADFEVSTIVTIASLFFAILVGFFIAGATSNYLRMQTLIATEEGVLMSLYNYVCLIARDRSVEVVDAIERYIIAVYEFDTLGYADDTRKELHRIVEVVDSVAPHDALGTELYANLHSAKAQLYAINQEMDLTTKEIVTQRHWTILLALALLIVLLTLALRDGSLLVNIVVSVLFLAMYQILVLVHEIDSNIFFASQLAYEPAQPFFDLTGRLHYYPAAAEKQGLLRDKKKPYRVGYVVETKRGPKRKIKVVK